MAPSAPNSQARFLPGAMLANRYRIVALLGRGGMGEVYRADDTKLGEAVALKLLPERLENDVALRERFIGEARLARQVAHPNVCRVYDIGEVDGRLFLSMEYVDGEDLATLLRRIGRLPQDKSVQLAREMCAGLQAAHAQGILHRDLKPSNVMIDGRGRARITDFGLAVLADSLGEGDATAGTPAYMAPEQLRGQDVTVRSDVYALGLVLYELFTGRPAFEAQGWAEQIRTKVESTPSAPSLVAPGLDPVIERVLMRCLLPDPAQRPASAAAVALALPGGDPLAAALAAGETPSPEMVAEAGGDQAYPAPYAFGWLAAFLAGLLALFMLAPRAYLIQLVPIEKPPAVLIDRARDIATELGWSARPGDEARAMMYDGGHGAYLGRTFGRGAVVGHLRRYPGGTFTLLYRRSPLPLIPFNVFALGPDHDDPPLTAPGMLSLTLDGGGRLSELAACPPDLDSLASPARAFDWAPVFALAGLDTARFRRVAPQWSPLTFADQRVAWLGSVPGDSAVPLRIEAASFHGRPVAFRRIHPWTSAAPTRAGSNALAWVIWIVFLGLLVLAGMAARANLRAGRADVRGALRLGMASALVLIARLWLGVHLAPQPQWMFARLLRTVGYGGLFFLITTMLYLTFEPVVRRTWPWVLVSWMRLLDGRWRDRRLGRDVMAGLASGVLLLLLNVALAQLWSRLTGKPLPADLIDTPSSQADAVLGVGAACGVVASSLTNALQSALSGTALLALFTVVTRRNALSLALAGATMLLISLPGSDNFAIGLALVVVTILALLVMLVRYGFVTLLVGVAVQSLLARIPLVAPGSSWYAPSTLVGVVPLLALALWSLRAMRSTRPESTADLAASLVSGYQRSASRASGAPASGRPASAKGAGPAGAAPAPPATPDSELPTVVSPRPGSPGPDSELPTEFSPRPGTPRE